METTGEGDALALEVKFAPGEMTASDAADMLEKAAKDMRAFADEHPTMPTRIVFDYGGM